MSNNAWITYAAGGASVAEIGALCNNGYLRIYAGTHPTNPGDAITTQTLLFEHRFANPAFGSPSNGSATATLADATSQAAETATFFIAFKSDGTTQILGGLCGTANAELILPTVTILLNYLLTGLTLTLTAPRTAS